MKFIIRVLVVAGTVFFLPQILGYLGLSGVSVSGFYSALIASVALALINLLIKPIITFITLPLNVLTLGLFGLVINGVIFYFLPMVPFVTGFAVGTFSAAFVGALIVSIVNWFVSKI
jgi:putative membrane protein